jgi:hypothetical protein
MLNRLDLPLPVAPENATTVRPPAIEVRTALLARAAAARSTPAAGRQPAPDSSADVNAAALACTDSAETADMAPADEPVLESDRRPSLFGLIARP